MKLSKVACFAFLVVVLFILTVTVGCGDDEKTSELTSEPTVTETVATEPSTAEPAGIVDVGRKGQ